MGKFKPIIRAFFFHGNTSVMGRGGVEIVLGRGCGRGCHLQKPQGWVPKTRLKKIAKILNSLDHSGSRDSVFVFGLRCSPVNHHLRPSAFLVCCFGG